jgi:hypothetical protein
MEVVQYRSLRHAELEGDLLHRHTALDVEHSCSLAARLNPFRRRCYVGPRGPLFRSGLHLAFDRTVTFGGQNPVVARKQATVLARARRSLDRLDEAQPRDEPVMTRCARCAWTHRGTVEAGREAFAEHRSETHSGPPV